MANALNVLSEREKQIIQYTYIEQISQKEAGERLGISQMHVSRLQRKRYEKTSRSDYGCWWCIVVEAFKNEHVEAYVYNAAKHGNIESGDTYLYTLRRGLLQSAIADGLGNGLVARQSAEVIPLVLERYHHESLDELLNRCNEYMVQKRSAAVSDVRVNYKEGTIEYSCVGNRKIVYSSRLQEDALSFTGYGVSVRKNHKK